jgi:hypothetical protein
MSQALYFLVVVYRALGQKEDSKRALTEYKRIETRIQDGLLQETPGWFIYYSARDALEHLLRDKDEDRCSTMK